MSIVYLFTLCLFISAVSSYSFSGVVQAPTPTGLFGNSFNARVPTKPILLRTNGGQLTSLTIKGVYGYNIVAVFCNVLKSHNFSSPYYTHVSLAGQTIDLYGETAICSWINNGGRHALGYASASVVFDSSYPASTTTTAPAQGGFPPAVDSNTPKCPAQQYDIAYPSFDINKMPDDIIYNSLYFYQLNEGNPGYQACYVNVYRSTNSNYDCSIIGQYNCFETANHFLTSYATVRTSPSGTICYALSKYQDLETATLLVSIKSCLLKSIVNIGNDPCAALINKYNFSGSVYC